MSEPFLRFDQEFATPSNLSLRIQQNKHLVLTQSFLNPGDRQEDRERIDWLKKAYQEADEAAWKAEKAARVKVAADQMFSQIQIHLLGWVEKVDAAMQVASEPPEKNATFYWVIALAGNLLWAATSLEIPSKLAQKLMSFGGAAVGSGVVEKARDAYEAVAADTKDNRKDIVMGEVARLQSELEEKFQAARARWANELDDAQRLHPSGDRFLEDLEAFVWNKMFAIPFTTDRGDGRYFQVYQQSKKNIEMLLGALRDQWEAWKDREKDKVFQIGDGMGPNRIVRSRPPEAFELNLTGIQLQIAGTIRIAEDSN
jgi:hypothetical protein